MATKEEFYNRLTALNEDFSGFFSDKKPATKEMVLDYAQQKDIKFNSDFIDFLTTYGAMIVEVKENIWKRPKPLETMPMWEFGYGFFVYGLSIDENFPEWLSYEDKYAETEFNGDLSIGQMFFKRSGNLYRAYINDNTITVETDKEGTDREEFKGNLYDFLIAEVDNLEMDYREYLKK
ncbi:hypothetical protein [Maribacter sp. Asnod2-G09]|uniref:hypothetical protein n=1 Tax=Maribacter sp. Asnod2-G09 TaxID=3160577 RepID=UPI00386965B1